eukprot:5861928-Prymnesium_polylepis.1
MRQPLSSTVTPAASHPPPRLAPLLPSAAAPGSSPPVRRRAWLLSLRAVLRAEGAGAHLRLCKGVRSQKDVRLEAEAAREEDLIDDALHDGEEAVAVVVVRRHEHVERRGVARARCERLEQWRWRQEQHVRALEGREAVSRAAHKIVRAEGRRAGKGARRHATAIAARVGVATHQRR